MKPSANWLIGLPLLYAISSLLITLVSNWIILPGKVIPHDTQPYYVSKPLRKSSSSLPIIIVLHGNGETAYEAYVFWQRFLQMFPCELYVPEYSGYGIFYHDSGHSLKNVFSRLCDFWETVILPNTMGRSVPVYIIGHSIGTGLALQLAQKFPASVHGVVLISPYSSLSQVIQQHVGSWIKWFLFISDIPSSEIVAQIQISHLIIHGTEDKLISPQHSELLSRKSHPSTSCQVVFVQGGHNTLPWNQVFQQISQFIRQCKH